MGLFDKLFGKKEETFDPNHIFAPMAGQTVPVAEIPDPTFAQGILGEGIAIIPADGMIAVEGLDADTYYLEETKAPGGYNRLAGPVKVEISHTVTDADAHMTHTLKQDATVVEKVEIENKSGTELPSTGGIGTTIFYVLGSILVLGAAVLLITKKRMSAAA